MAQGQPRFSAAIGASLIVVAMLNPSEMTYDLLGRRLSLANPDTGLTTYTFDDAGNLTKKVTPNLAAAQSILYAYHFNRLTRVDFPASTDIRYFYGGRPPRTTRQAG